MYNKIVLVGNLTRDIELRYSQAGLAIANTALATSRKFTANGEKKEEVCFVDITAFGRSGEIMNQYLRKGSKILVEGRLNFDQWQDQNGQKRSKHSVVVESMQMLDNKDSSPQNGKNAPGYANVSSAPLPTEYEQHPDYPRTPQQQQDQDNAKNHVNEPAMDQHVPEVDANE